MVDSGDTDFPILPRYENSYASLQNSPFPSQGSLDYERVSEYVANSNQFQSAEPCHLMAEDHDQFEGNLENLKYKSPEFKQRFVSGRDSILLVSQEFLDDGNIGGSQQSDTYQIMSKNTTSKKSTSDQSETSNNWKTTEPEKLAEKFGLEKFLESSENPEFEKEPKNEVWIDMNIHEPDWLRRVLILELIQIT